MTRTNSRISVSETDSGAVIERRLRIPGALLITLFLIAAPVVFLAWVRLGLEERVEGIQVSPEALVMPVSRTLDDAQVPATATLEWIAGSQLLSPGLEGVVTGLYLSPGTIVREGDAVIQVNGVDRLAARLPAPFFRSLAPRDTGSDVEALQGFLQRTGRFSGEIDGVYGSTTSAAVRSLESDIGVRRPTGVFEPGMLVWLPSDSFEVGHINVQLASSGPPLGSVIAEATAVVVAGSVSYAPTSIHSSGPLVFKVGDLMISLNSDGRSISDDGLEDLTTAVDPEVIALEGHVAMAEPVPLWQVPTTSVVVGEGGNTCVWLVASEPGSYAASEVVISSSTFTGASLVAEGVEDGDRVLVNPFEVLESPSCP